MISPHSLLIAWWHPRARSLTVSLLQYATFLLLLLLLGVSSILFRSLYPHALVGAIPALLLLLPALLLVLLLMLLWWRSVCDIVIRHSPLATVPVKGLVVFRWFWVFGDNVPCVQQAREESEHAEGDVDY